MSDLLTERDWLLVRMGYARRQPFGFVILDDFLAPGVFHGVRQTLLADGGWARKNWQVKQLFNREPPIANLDRIVSEIKTRLGSLTEGLDLVKHWAVACHENAGLHVHADNAYMALNLWLTPDEYNLNPATGGLILYRLKRRPDMLVHEFNAMPWAGEFFEKLAPEVLTVIPYRANRAVLFDASIFHASDAVEFREGAMSTIRLGLTMALDVRSEYKERMSNYVS
ncbi:hypothetical protein [Bradyrhizobium sp. Cp5.3]|uniref:hypothetical protein n=1 Tax=Bradyrhizobium sp. Cp5.3 TaxID=443598 RepID=UPI0004809F70|nr:hypothetical protein [Bradyrhizobium sp. Cp5.3]